MKNYPACKKNPQLLTVQELANPLDAMRDLFWSYDIEEIRTHCWNWLVTSLQDEDVNAGNSILFYEDLMKFIEAAHLFLHEENKHATYKPTNE
jgi:hypothetical protein